VGDCVQMQDEKSFDVVDCGGAEAQAAIWTEDAIGADGTTWSAVPVA